MFSFYRINPLLTKECRLLFYEAPQRQPEAQPATSGTEHGDESAELARLRLELADANTRIDDLEQRGVADLIGNDIDRAKQFATDQYELVTSYWRGVAHDLVGSGKEALSAVQKAMVEEYAALMVAKQEMLDALARLEADVRARLAEAGRQVVALGKETYETVVKAGVVTIDEIQDMANWGVDKVVSIATKAKDKGILLSQEFWQETLESVHWTGDQIATAFQELKDAGVKTQALVESIIDQGATSVIDFAKAAEARSIQLGKDFWEASVKVVDYKIDQAKTLVALAIGAGVLTTKFVVTLANKNVDRFVALVDAAKTEGVRIGTAAWTEFVNSAKWTGEKAIAIFDTAVGAGAASAEIAMALARQGKNWTVEQGVDFYRRVEAAGLASKEVILALVNKNVDRLMAFAEAGVQIGQEVWTDVIKAKKYTTEQALALYEKAVQQGVAAKEIVMAFASQTTDKAIAFAQAAQERGIQLGKEFYEIVANNVKMKIDQAKTLVELAIGAGALTVVLVVKLANNSVDRLNILVDAAKAKGVEIGNDVWVAFLEGKKYTTEQALALYEKAADAGAASKEFVVKLIDSNYEKAIALAREGKTIAQDVWTEVVVDAKWTADQALAVLDTLIGVGVDVSEVVAALAKQAASWSTEQAFALYTIASDKALATERFVTTLVNHNIDRALALAEKGVEIGKETWGDVVRETKVGADKALALLDTMIGAGIETKDYIMALAQQAEDKMIAIAGLAIARGQEYAAFTEQYIEAVAARINTMATEKVVILIKIVGDKADYVAAITRGLISAGNEKLIAVVEACKDAKVKVSRDLQDAYVAAKREQRRLQRKGKTTRESATKTATGVLRQLGDTVTEHSEYYMGDSSTEDVNQ